MSPRISAITAHARLPRLTRRAFADLGLWMLALGIFIGLVFPFALLALAVPRQVALRPGFFAVTVLAGLVLAAANFVLTRWVVGARVQALSQQMRHVGDVISEATFSGDWSQCSPQECRLVVDSDDELGDVAASFNELLGALDGSRHVQLAMSDHARALAAHLELQDFSDTTLASFRSAGHADAGALCVVREGELDAVATHRLDPAGLTESVSVQAGLSATGSMWLELPDGIAVDAAVLSFSPATVLVMPLIFRAAAIGVMVLAFAQTPTPETIRLLEAFADPTEVALNNALAHERFQRLAAIDPLTGAYNRRFGLGRLGEEWARAVRTGTPLGLLAFDIDHFKAVNDTYGHLAGDRVLRQITGTARLALRDGDVLIRTGGEEFLVVLPGAGQDDVHTVGERLRRSVAGSTVPIGATEVAVSVSLGGATFSSGVADSAEELIAAADEAMYASKQAGRDRLTMCGAQPVGAGRA